MRDHGDAITALSGLGPLRVWSVLVTVFGDLAPDAALDGPTLSALMDGIGIKPEATRVALHRLRADGWITSQKQGRISRYSLTPKGQQDSAAARPRIYARPDSTPSTLKAILMPEHSAALNAAHFALITPGLYLCQSDTAAPSGAMVLHVGDIPDWLGPQFEPPALVVGYQALFDVLTQIQAHITAPRPPLETALLRVLIVHAWRRLVLKHPALPRSAHSPMWREHDCRALVATLLGRFERPAPDQINGR